MAGQTNSVQANMISVPIPAPLVSAVVNGYVTVSDEIYDSQLNKTQDEINQELYGSIGQISPVLIDWNETDESSFAYIKNKPEVLTSQDELVISSTLNDLNDRIEDLPLTLSLLFLPKITSSTTLSADLIQNGSINKTVTESEKTSWSGKQNALVSGTNIKTINGESILGSGNISISTGTGGDINVIESITFNGNNILVTNKNAAITYTAPVTSVNGNTGAVTLTIPDAQIQSDWNLTTNSAKDFIKNKPTNVSSFINDANYLTLHQTLKTINNTAITGSGNVYTYPAKVTLSLSTATINPNTLNIWSTIPSLITLADGSSGIVNEYMIRFSTGNALSLVFPDIEDSEGNDVDIIWNETPSLENNATYEISIIDGYGVITRFKNTVSS